MHDPLLQKDMTPCHSEFWGHVAEAAEDLHSAITAKNVSRIARKGQGLLRALSLVYAMPAVTE